MDVETTLPPEKVREMLLDFSANRPEIWPGIAPEFYEVLEVGDTWAEIKEGTKAPGMKIWAIERYDWSVPGTVKWTVKESNFSKPGSFVQAEIAPGDQGGSRIHVTWSREGIGLLGKFAIRLIALTRGKPVAQSVRAGLKKAEQAQAG